MREDRLLGHPVFEAPWCSLVAPLRLLLHAEEDGAAHEEKEEKEDKVPPDGRG